MLKSLYSLRIFKMKLQEMLNDLRKEPNDGVGRVLAAGDLEKKTFKERYEDGLIINDELVKIITN